MDINKMLLAVIELNAPSLHDINHLIKVLTYARLIAGLEGVEKEETEIIEAAAMLHDIACPSLREQYGTAPGELQQSEGAKLARRFLEPWGLSERQLERIVYLVSRHHTFSGVDGMDYQILLEADFLVNAEESGYSRKSIESFEVSVFKTESGRRLLHRLYLDSDGENSARGSE